MSKLTGSRAYERFIGSQIKKVYERKKEVYDETERISLVSSFLASLFAGKYVSINETDAAGMNLMDIKNCVWSEVILEATAPGLEEKLGRLAPAHAVAGAIAPYFVERYQFIPQLIFLNSLFGYLSLLITLKWVSGSQADLYHVMIYMFHSPTDELADNQLFPGQRIVQLTLLFLALITVPWMLFPKPFLLKKQHQERHQGQAYTILQTTEADMLEEQDLGSHDHEEFEFSEVFVHQLIPKIEFVLGAVSNTASYLRLWALRYHNPFILAIGALVFIFVTVGVLLVMETECLPTCNEASLGGVHKQIL